MRIAAVWAIVGAVLFFGFGLRGSPLNFSPVVEIGVFAAVGCWILAFAQAATHPPSWS